MWELRAVPLEAHPLRGVEPVAPRLLDALEHTYQAAFMWEGYLPRAQNAGLLEQIVLNYPLFVPLGCLLPFTWPVRYFDAGVARGVARVSLEAAA